MSVQQRLKDLGLVLPKPAAPVAAYVPTVRTGDLLFVSGQICFVDGVVAVTGKLGAGVSLERGVEAARLCAVNILAQIAAALDGDLERVTRIVKMTGFVACTPDFTDQPKVINGASELMLAVFGDLGRHARAAVGVPSLPLDSAVEVEAVVEVRGR